MESGAEAVDGLDRFVVCGGSALEGLVVVCTERNVGIFVDVFVIEVESTKAASVIYDLVKAVEFEVA